MLLYNDNGHRGYISKSIDTYPTKDESLGASHELC